MVNPDCSYQKALLLCSQSFIQPSKGYVSYLPSSQHTRWYLLFPFIPLYQSAYSPSICLLNHAWINSLRSDFTSKLNYGLAFGIPKFYIPPYDKINHALINLSYNCDVKSSLRLVFETV